MAVRLSDEIGSRDAARWLGLSYNTLSAWRKQEFQKTYEIDRASAGSMDLQQEVAYLREANAILLDTVSRLWSRKDKAN